MLITYLKTLHDDEADNDIIFGNMVGRAKNPKQLKILDEYLQRCKEVYKYLVDIDEHSIHQILNTTESAVIQNILWTRNVQLYMLKKVSRVHIASLVVPETHDRGKNILQSVLEKQGRQAPAMNSVVNIDSLSIATQTE